MILGFAPSSMTDELLARQQMLWAVWLEGFVSLPINLPGFGEAGLLQKELPFNHCCCCPSIFQALVHVLCNAACCNRNCLSIIAHALVCHGTSVCFSAFEGFSHGRL